MLKTIDINRNLYEISKEYPEVITIMKEMGFEDITKPGMINTVGRFMTISKGSSMKNIPMDKIKENFKNYGYELID